MLRARSLLKHAFVLLCGSGSDLDGSIPFIKHPAFPFIGQEKVRVTTEENEKNEREEGFQDRWVLLLLHAGLTDPVDVNRDGSMSRPCSLLAPCAGVICRSWRSILSQRTSW